MCDSVVAGRFDDEILLRIGEWVYPSWEDYFVIVVVYTICCFGDFRGKFCGVCVLRKFG